MARLQMRHVPHLLVAAVLFCGFGFLPADDEVTAMTRC